MDKPNPELSRIKENFLSKFTNIVKTDELEALKQTGELIFKPEDINATPWAPDRLLRRLFVENNITDAYFNEKYKIYAYLKLGLHPIKASNNRSNIMKAIKKGHITYTKLIEVINNILGFEITDMMFVFSDPSGSKHTIQLKENKSNND